MEKRLYVLVGNDINEQNKWLGTWEDSYLTVQELDEKTDINDYAVWIDNLYNYNIHNIVIIGKNLSKRRTSFIRTFHERYKDIKIVLVFFPKPLSKCKGNEIEELKIFHGFYEEFAFNMIHDYIIVNGTVGTRDVREIPQEYWYYNQDALYHVKSLGKHIQAVSDYVEKRKASNSKLKTAIYYHYVSKPKARTYTDLGGNVSAWAHYYNYQNLSEYTWYCDNTNLTSPLVHYVGALIQKVAEDNYESKKIVALNKAFEEKFGYDFIEDLKLFREADEYRTKWEKIVIAYRKKFKS